MPSSLYFARLRIIHPRSVDEGVRSAQLEVFAAGGGGEGIGGGRDRDRKLLIPQDRLAGFNLVVKFVRFKR